MSCWTVKRSLEPWPITTPSCNNWMDKQNLVPQMDNNILIFNGEDIKKLSQIIESPNCTVCGAVQAAPASNYCPDSFHISARMDR